MYDHIMAENLLDLATEFLPAPDPDDEDIDPEKWWSRPDGYTTPALRDEDLANLGEIHDFMPEDAPTRKIAVAESHVHTGFDYAILRIAKDGADSDYLSLHTSPDTPRHVTQPPDAEEADDAG